jgi:uracil-DNA glycosylase family 4
MSRADHERLAKRIVACRRCPRLVRWCRHTAREKTRRYADWDYWGKPVPGFGDPNARLLLVGLAPAAHGANRTGRMFTGDRSGEWLYRSLHAFGFASQSVSESISDGLALSDCYVTAACRCAPPANKPLPRELSACRPYLVTELTLLKDLRVVIGLGKIGHQAAYQSLVELGQSPDSGRAPRFGHGSETRFGDRWTLLASFHPSQQNTFTGRLTRPMFDAVFRRARALLEL